MEETDLQWHVTIQGAPAGTQASVTLTLSSGSGGTGQTSNGSADITGSFGKVPDGNTNHWYTATGVATATVNGIKLSSLPVSTKVWELWIGSFRDDATGKEWKVCVGDAISYSGLGSPDLTDWQWDMPDGGLLMQAWHLQNANGRSGSSAMIPFSDEQRADNDWFGDKYGNVRVKAKDANGNWYTFRSKDEGLKAKVFFEPGKARDGNAPTNANPPAWFVFWMQAFGGASDVSYDLNTSYGSTHPDGHIDIGDNGNPNYATPFSSGYDRPGNGKSGIDLFFSVLTHELRHRQDDAWIGSHPGAQDGDGDGLPDDIDPFPGLINGAGYPEYSDPRMADWEYYPRSVEGVSAPAGVDWSRGGKQW